MKLFVVALLILAFSVSGFAPISGQVPALAPRLQNLNVNFMVRGYFFAGSPIDDKNALGGFGASDNLPKTLDASMNVPDGDISVIAYPDQEVAFDKKYRGLRVILANGTNERFAFSASDSRLYMIQEAIDADGKWKPVEYLPSSWCGNSYHTVFLPSHEYWEFSAVRYTGKRPTKFRIKLSIQDPAEKTRTIFSNEYAGSVNPKQFTVQQGHSPNGIMDPYNN